MKRLKLSLLTLLFTCLIFAISPAKADDPGAPCGGADVDSPCGGGDTSLPINNAVWLLIAAGVVIGTKATFRKNKPALEVK
jgi:hypothetical protein